MKKVVGILGKVTVFFIRLEFRRSELIMMLSWQSDAFFRNLALQCPSLGNEVRFCVEIPRAKSLDILVVYYSHVSVVFELCHGNAELNLSHYIAILQPLFSLDFHCTHFGCNHTFPTFKFCTKYQNGMCSFRVIGWTILYTYCLLCLSLALNPPRWMIETYELQVCTRDSRVLLHNQLQDATTDFKFVDVFNYKPYRQCHGDHENNLT